MIARRNFLIFFICTICFTFIKGQSFKPNAQLEQFIPLYRGFRKGLFQLVGPTSGSARSLQLARRFHKLQDEIPADVPFPCNVTGFRSLKRPSSVHKLRPGDIDIVGALGDSLTAGYGLAGINLLHVLMENRGLSWSIGGQGTWRQYVTLPNILKEFNPNLIGYSLGDSYSDNRASQFNPAEGAAISSEVPYMAKILIKRIKNDRRVNLKKDWKLITIMIGANDFCLDICFKNNMTMLLEDHRADMIEVLRLLRDNLPRTIVNLVPPPHLKPIVEAMKVPELCQIARKLECFCLFANQQKKNREAYYRVMKAWQDIDKEVTRMPEFHITDFEVVLQPTVSAAEIPKVNPEQTDFTFMSADCFHLSQKMNARAANSLWNNMLQREGTKTHEVTPLLQPFLCPTKENPYIFTSMNS